MVKCIVFLILLHIVYIGFGSSYLAYCTKILKFIHKLKNIDFTLDKKKFQNIIESTDFQKVQKLEDKKGFEESMIDKNTGKKIKFFRSGAQTDWQTSLEPALASKIQNAFEKEMIELGYL